MVYIRFSRATRSSRSTWVMFDPALPIATIARRRGKCRATIRGDRKLKSEERAILSAFVKRRELEHRKEIKSRASAALLNSVTL